MSIFPFLDPQVVDAPLTEKPLIARDWAWDFKKNDFKLKDGKMYIVEGKEAIRIWIWKILQTPRYRYLIYSWDYGHELEQLFGRSYSQAIIQSEAERLIKEAIWPTLNGYVTDIQNLTVNVNRDMLKISFTAVTPYGEVEIDV